MKKFLIVVVLILLIIGLSPLLGGMKAQQELDKLVSYIDAQPGYSAQWSSYKRGWMQSQGSLAIIIGAAEFTPQEQTFTVPLSLSLNHGPLLLGNDFGMGWFSGQAEVEQGKSGETSSWLVTEAQGSIWSSKFKMGLGGTTELTDQSQAFSVNLGEESVGVSEYRGEGKITPLGHLTYSGALPLLALLGKDVEVLVEDVKLDADLSLGTLAVSHNFAPGDVVFSIKNATGTGEGIDNFRLKDLKFLTHSVQIEQKPIVDLAVKIQFEELSLDQNQIDEFNFALAIERLSLDFIKKYTDSLAALNDPVSTQPMAFDVLGLVSTDLIPPQPILKIEDFSFKSEKGDLTFSGAASVPLEDPSERVNPFVIFQNLLINAEFEADKSLVLAMLAQSSKGAALSAVAEQNPPPTAEEFEQMLNEQAATQLDILQLQGMFVQSGDSITSTFEFKEGLATLNGNPVPLSF